jgi:hypothetical protein
VSFGIEILNRETYAVVLIRRETERLSKELGRSDLRSGYETSAERVSLSLTMKRGLKLPILLLVRSPIVLLLSLYVAVVYGLLYLLFTNIYHRRLPEICRVRKRESHDHSIAGWSCASIGWTAIVQGSWSWLGQFLTGIHCARIPAPVPIFFSRNGQLIREKFPVNLDS